MVISRSLIFDLTSWIFVMNSWIFLQSICRISCSFPCVFYLHAQFCKVYRVFRCFQRSLGIHSLEAFTERNSFCTVSVHIFLILATAFQALSSNSQIFSSLAKIVSIRSSLSSSFGLRGGDATAIPSTCLQSLAFSKGKLMSCVYCL